MLSFPTALVLRQLAVGEFYMDVDNARRETARLYTFNQAVFFVNTKKTIILNLSARGV